MSSKHTENMKAGIEIAPGDTFPYKRLDHENYAPEIIRRRFNALKKSMPKLVALDSPPNIKYLKGVPVRFTGNKCPEFAIFEQAPEDYLGLNEISDYFIEPIRVRCPRGNRMTPIEAWTGQKRRIEGLSKKFYGPALTPHSLRETVYRFRGVDECGTFRPKLLVDVVREFKLKRILDSSSGWGDRLIGAMASGVSYVGTDPNLALQPAYNAMMAEFAPKNRKYSIATSKFEDFVIPSFKFDSVITSPPYYTYENYAPGSEPQWKDVSEFIDGFLVPTIRKSVAALAGENDRAYFFINDTGEANYMAETLRRLGTTSDSPLFRGIIAYGEKTTYGDTYRNIQSIFVFEKN